MGQARRRCGPERAAEEVGNWVGPADDAARNGLLSDTPCSRPPDMSGTVIKVAWRIGGARDTPDNPGKSADSRVWITARGFAAWFNIRANHART
ncbi:hypothetical protein MBOU_02970 [Mycobacterium bourgelatii]|uniref:Uncharacterized protein n=1 Tax=Mycobacterium bourgelatii TaxID=1273442 RepID=A0A7I9YHU6_MYCBU|nr:hypothetical protein MBOU_02970 [Mycobacterium bourgelatii]